MRRQVSCGVKSNTTALSGLQVIPQWNLTEAERGQSAAPLLKTLLEQLTKSESVLYTQLCEKHTPRLTEALALRSVS